jgi:hypothetical protein
MKLNLYVPILDLLAFFLITPEILGPERIGGINTFLTHPIIVAPYYTLKIMIAGNLGFSVSDEDIDKAAGIGMASSLVIVVYFLITNILVLIVLHGREINTLYRLIIALTISVLTPVSVYIVVRALGFLRKTFLRRSVIVILAILLFVSARVIEIDTRWTLHLFGQE